MGLFSTTCNYESLVRLLINVILFCNFFFVRLQLRYKYSRCILAFHLLTYFLLGLETASQLRHVKFSQYNIRSNYVLQTILKRSRKYLYFPSSSLFNKKLLSKIVKSRRNKKEEKEEFRQEKCLFLKQQKQQLTTRPLKWLLGRL